MAKVAVRSIFEVDVDFSWLYKHDAAIPEFSRDTGLRLYSFWCRKTSCGIFTVGYSTIKDNVIGRSNHSTQIALLQFDRFKQSLKNNFQNLDTRLVHFG